jgi:hypothetical protein
MVTSEGTPVQVQLCLVQQVSFSLLPRVEVTLKLCMTSSVVCFAGSYLLHRPCRQLQVENHHRPMISEPDKTTQEIQD